MKMDPYGSTKNSGLTDLRIETQNESSIEIDHIDYMISIKEEKEYCVGKVDILDSSKTTAILGINNIYEYYQIFFNSASQVIKYFGGKIIKNVGSAMLYYFPESEKRNQSNNFMSCIECGLGIIQIHEEMCNDAIRQGLPIIDYKISADYGKVTVINSGRTNSIDLLGTPMNVCSKIMEESMSNQFVIGKNLYKVVRDNKKYNFKLKTNPDNSRYNIPLYEVTRNNDLRFGQ